MELKFSGSIQDLPASDRLELLLDSVTDCAIYLLDRDGVIRTWNKGAERIKGYRAAEVIGQHAKTKRPTCRTRFWRAPAAAGGPSRRAGVSARMVAGSGRHPWSNRCAMPAAAPSALPKSPAT